MRRKYNILPLKLLTSIRSTLILKGKNTLFLDLKLNKMI